MGIVNTYDQLKAAVAAGTTTKRTAVAVSYHPRAAGRMGYADCSKAKVWSPYMKLDPDSHFLDYGAKVFYLSGKDWRAAMEEAMQWASRKYRIKEWSRNRIGDYVPAIVNQKHPIPKREATVRAEGT